MTSKSQPKVTAPPARKSKSAPKSQKVAKGAKAADTLNENESPAVLYAQGSFVAFIDKTDVEHGLQQIAIGKVSLPSNFGFSALFFGPVKLLHWSVN